MTQPVRITLLMAVALCYSLSLSPVLGQPLLAQNKTGKRVVSNPHSATTLREALMVLKQRYGIDILFEEKMLEGIRVTGNSVNQNASLERTLSDLLTPVGLRFKKVRSNTYLVMPDEGTKTGFRQSATTAPVLLGETREQNETPSQQVVDKILTGTVKSETGEGLPGVTVLIKNTSRGTTTDVNGHFQLNLPDENTILVFSFVGYVMQEIAVANQSVVDIQLKPDDQTLNEVVVVGYGTQKKSVVTGAISSVKSTDLDNQQISRVEQALQGRASGLTIASSSGAPGTPATVRVRGTTSLNEGASNPLYVVDGVVVGTGGIDYLNPGDIESVEVLKDAASAAIYGARSSAGVILVTTKKGKTGGIRVAYSGYFGTQAPARKLNLLDATQYATLINEQSINAGGKELYANPGSLGRGTDWQQQIFNSNARIQNHEVSLSGGNDRSTFYTSFGLFDQQGIVATDISGFKRYNIRLNSDHKIKDWLRFGQTLGYSHINNKSGVNGNTDFGGPLSSAIMLDPLTPVVITDPAVAAGVPYSTQPVITDVDGNPYAISTNVVQQVTNPLAFNKTRHGNYTWSDDIVGNVFLVAEPIKGLRLRSTLGTTLSYGGSETFTPVSYLNSNQITTQNSFARANSKGINWNLENTVSYDRVIGKHDFTALLGQGAYMDNNTVGSTVTYFNIPAKTFEEASLNFSTPASNINASGFEGVQHRVTSLFSRLTYSYDGRFLFTGIVRRDGSSRFGINNRYGYFPSASLGWVASQERFWAIKNTINFLKIRGSYGITGNDVLGNFRYLSTVGGGRNFTFGNDIYLIGYSPDAPANPDLRWEQTSQLNLGLDMVLFQNWNLTLDWYNKKTSGILQTIVYPGYVGAVGASYGNVAMVNRGVELELGYRKRFGKVSMDLRGNVSYLKNQVTYLGAGKSFLEGGAKLQNSTYELTRTAIGQPVGAFYGFQTAGIFQTKEEVSAYVGPDGKPIQPNAVPGDFRWVDLNNDGKITADDRTFIGNPIPNWSFGFTGNVSWNNFDLLVFGQGVGGNDIFKGLRRLDIPTANWQTKALNRWHGAGTSDTYPRLTTKDANNNFSNPSTYYLEPGDYFRIKTLQVGYTLPAALSGKVGIQKARVYVSSNNLVTFTNYTGYDPEIGGSSYGIDRAIYPQSRSFLLGLNIGF